MASNAPKTTSYQPKKTKTKPHGSIGIGTKTRLSLKISLLLIQVSLKARLLRKLSVMETVKEAMQLLGSIRLKWQRRTRIRPRTGAISSATLANKKATIPTCISKSQKTSAGLGNLHVDN